MIPMDPIKQFEKAKAAALKVLRTNRETLIAKLGELDAQIAYMEGKPTKPTSKPQKPQRAAATGKPKKRERLSAEQLAAISGKLKAMLPASKADAIHFAELRKVKAKDSTIKALLGKLKAKHAGAGKWYL